MGSRWEDYTTHHVNVGADLYESGFLHSAVLWELEPSTTYYYACGDEDRRLSSTRSFRTPGAVSPEERATLAILGDLGQTNDSRCGVVVPAACLPVGRSTRAVVVSTRRKPRRCLATNHSSLWFSIICSGVAAARLVQPWEPGGRNVVMGDRRGGREGYTQRDVLEVAGGSIPNTGVPVLPSTPTKETSETVGAAPDGRRQGLEAGGATGM